MKTLADKTRARKVSLEELQGGTFSITNVGPMGGGQLCPSSTTLKSPSWAWVPQE